MKRFAPSLLVLLAACSGGGGDGNSSQAAKGPAIAAPAGANWTETVARTPEGGFRMGNPNAPVKLVEYGARTCPTCGASLDAPDHPDHAEGEGDGEGAGGAADEKAPWHFKLLVVLLVVYLVYRGYEMFLA